MTRAVELEGETLVAAAHGMGIHRWRSRVELEQLVESWPAAASYVRGMSREIKTTTIGGREYRVPQLGVKSARDVQVRLMRTAPAILLGSMLDFGGLAGLNTEDVSAITDTLLADTEVGMVDTKGDGRVTFVKLTSQLDHCFAGKPLEYWKLVFFALEANNFQEVFQEVAALVARRGQSATSGSPTEATGTSGDSSSPPA